MSGRGRGDQGKRGTGNRGGGGGGGRGRGAPQQQNPRGAGGDSGGPQRQQHQQRHGPGGGDSAWGGGHGGQGQGPRGQGTDGRYQLPPAQQQSPPMEWAQAQPTPGVGDDEWQSVSRRPQREPREQQVVQPPTQAAWGRGKPQGQPGGRPSQQQQRPSAPAWGNPQGQQFAQGPSQQQQRPSAPAWGNPQGQQFAQGSARQQQRPSPPGWGTPQPEQNIPNVAHSSSSSTPATVQFLGILQEPAQQQQQEFPSVEGAMGSLSMMEQQPPTASGGEVGDNWHFLPAARKDILLPVRKGLGTVGGRIQIRTNHFPLTITLPKNIYVYKVEVERQQRAPEEGQAERARAQAVAPRGPTKWPKRVIQKILKCFQMKLIQDYNIGIHTDLSTNIYSTLKIEDAARRLIFELNMSEFQGGPNDPDPEEDERGIFQIRLEPTPLEIDLDSLRNDINNMEGKNNPKLLKDLPAIYNAVLKCMPNYKYLALGRSLLIRFPEPGQDGHRLGSGLTSWPGISACINPGWKYYLELGLGYSTMIIGAPVLKALTEHFRGQDCTNVRQWRREDIQSASKFLERCKVRYEPKPGKVLSNTVQRVHEEPPSIATFLIGNRRITVQNYFRETYGTTLRHPDGPLLVFTGKGSMVPAELCTIKSGQSVNRKLNDEQTREMVNIARKKPDELERSLEKAARDLRLNENSLFKQFGIKFQEKMLQLECRVLDPPIISYKSSTGPGEANAFPKDGVWNVWQHNFKFNFKTSGTGTGDANKKPWGIFVIGGERDLGGVGPFTNAFLSVSRQCGMAFQDKPIVDSRRMRDDNEHADNVKIFKKAFQDFKQNQCIVVIVVIPRKPSSFYGQVKQAAELSSNGVGILTQCILALNFSPRPPKRMDNNSATVQQLLLKVNSKLNGVNHCVTIPPRLTRDFSRINLSTMKEPVMFLGADVTHPPPGSSVKNPKNPREQIPAPSFAAVTASIDRTGMPYMMHVKAQGKAGRGAAEVVQDMEDIVVECLKTFIVRNNCLPGIIIYFRDGVGDGQFPELLDIEMRAIRKACSRFDERNYKTPYQPKITFITVQKRHKTRFFMSTRDGTVNAPPGTVVDTQIVHPTETDFFLLSHRAIQGTSRPTRYHLLWDDNDFTQDEIQTLTYYMCHMYVRCNRSVKIPAPTYYAHWAAARAKNLADGYPIEEDLGPLNQMIRREDNFANAFPMHFI